MSRHSAEPDIPTPAAKAGVFRILTRERLGWMAALIAVAVLLGGTAAVALTTGGTIACQPGQEIRLKADNTWACVDPLSTPTPSPSATQSPSPSPTPSATPSVSPSVTVSPTPSPSATTVPPTPSPSVSPSVSPTMSPTPTPSPTFTGPPGRTCAAFPAMPDASCTGVPAGVVLHSCALEIHAAGTYDSCLFNGSVQVMAKNVTITRSKVLGRVGDGGLNWSPGGQFDETRNFKLVDVEVDGSSLTDPVDKTAAAIGQDGWSCLRCNIHHTLRGANFGTGVTITDSFFHDFVQVDDAHMSAAGNNGGQHSKIVHNTLDCQVQACSGALVMYGDFDPISDILITQNLFNSPGSYCLYAGSTPGSGKPYPVATNVRVIDNLWGRKYVPVYPNGQSGPPFGPRCGLYGPVSPGTWPSAAPSIWSGNKWQDGSGTVNP